MRTRSPAEAVCERQPSAASHLLDFTGAALAAHNAAGRARHAAHAGETDNHEAALTDLELALTALDEALPRVTNLGPSDATTTATLLHTELHALAAGCTLPALQAETDHPLDLELIGSRLDALLDRTADMQATGA